MIRPGSVSDGGGEGCSGASKIVNLGSNVECFVYESFSNVVVEFGNLGILGFGAVHRILTLLLRQDSICLGWKYAE